MNKRTGRFISLEGGEGAGKSTQAKALAFALEAKGYTVTVTREPGGTASAEIIRGLLLNGAEEKWNIRTEALLFAASRAEHCAKLIRPALARGDWVISDRFIDSNRAYQSVNGELTDDEILGLHRVGSENLMPDRTFILDVPEEVSAKRAAARDHGGSDRIGRRNSEYHRAVMAKFRNFAVNEPERIRLINASKAPDIVTDSLIESLSDLMK